MKSVPLPRIGMRVVKTAVAVMLSYTIFVPFGLIYNEALGGVWGQLGPLYACIACIICTQSTLGQTIQQGLSRLIGVAVAEPWVPPPCCWAPPWTIPGYAYPPWGRCAWRGCGSACCSSGPPPVAWRASCPASFSSPASPV